MIMERRIKIVWMLSIVAMLLITGGQLYWLRNQYQYMNDEQIDDIYNSILQQQGNMIPSAPRSLKRYSTRQICSSII